MHKHVEGLRYTRPRDIITLDDRLIGLRTADDIIRLEGEQFLQDIRRAISFQRPNFHFAKTLTTELRFTTQRLLRNKAVWPDAPRVHLIIHHMVQLDDIDDAHGCLLVKPFAGLPIIEIGMAEYGQARFLDMLGYFVDGSPIEDRRSELDPELLPGPSKDGLIDLSEVHTGRYAQWVQHHIHRCSVFQERHVF